MDNRLSKRFSIRLTAHELERIKSTLSTLPYDVTVAAYIRKAILKKLEEDELNAKLPKTDLCK